MSVYNPWHGCHKYSEGCKNCYMFYFDAERGIDSNIVHKTKDFNLPLKKDKEGNFKIRDGENVEVCLTSDFFIEEADEWRKEVWEMIRLRKKVHFILFTKRVNRIIENLPQKFVEDFQNVEFAITCENQKRLEQRMPYIIKLPTNNISLLISPMLEKINISKLLQVGKIRKVYCSGENYKNARLLDFEWVKDLYNQCKENHIKFEFFHTGNKLLKDGKVYKIPYKLGKIQAKLSGLNDNI